MVTADAGATTRTITAKMYGAETAWLRWDPNKNVSVGYLTVPAGMPAGKYAIKVTAEDIAHNISTKEVFLAVLP